jgi:hypothetical protein
MLRFVVQRPLLIIHIRDLNPETKNVVLPRSQAFELRLLGHFSQNDVNLSVGPPAMEFLYAVSSTTMWEAQNDIAPNIYLLKLQEAHVWKKRCGGGET